MRSSWASSWAGSAVTAVTSGRPSVSVPVLSRTTVSIRPAASSASPPRTRIPASAPRPVPTMIAVGVASPIAHGHAMITTPMNAVSARVSRGSGPSAYQATNVSAARTRTAGTNTSLMRSARCWIGALDPWARWTSSTIRARAVSRPTRVARMTNEPVVLSVAPMTSSPGRLVDGSGSPVSIDSSTAETPSTTMPSTGTRSPGRTRSRSPGTTSASSTSASTPSRIRRAVDRLEADQPPDRGRGAALGPGLEPSPEEHEAEDDRRRVEVADGLDARRHHDLRPQRHEHGVGPRRGRADGDQRVHRRAAVPPRPPRSAVEALAGPQLDERRRQQDQAVRRLHRDRALGRREHDGHEREGRADRDRGLDERPPLRPIALRVLGGELGVEAGRRVSIRPARRPPGGRRSPPTRRPGPARRDPRPPDPRPPWRAPWPGSPRLSATPGVRDRKRSIRFTHEAHVMPSMGRTISMGVVESSVRAVVILPGSIPAGLRWTHARPPAARRNVRRRPVGPGPDRRRPGRRRRGRVARDGRGVRRRPGAARLRPGDPAGRRRRGPRRRARGGRPGCRPGAARRRALGARARCRWTSPIAPSGTGWCSRRSGRSPAASTAGYGEVARRIGRPGAARAVGGAVGRNPVGLLIPCHRVIAGDGTLGGYGAAAWGGREAALEVKRELLALEGVELRAGRVSAR